MEELSGLLCDATLATTGSGAMLEMLEASNLLVVPLDHRRERFRYHHLFRDLLRMELEHRSPEIVPVLTARASVWCEAKSLTDQAVAYAIAGHDVDRVGELIARYAQATYYGGPGERGQCLDRVVRRPRGTRKVPERGPDRCVAPCGGTASRRGGTMDRCGAAL